MWSTFVHRIVTSAADLRDSFDQGPVRALVQRLTTVLPAAAILLGAAALIIAGVFAPFSPSGWLAIVAVTSLGIALLLRPGRARRVLGAAAAVILVGGAVLRLGLVGRGSTRLVTLPGGPSSRWLGRLVDEQDVSLLGARGLRWLWHLKGAERDGLVPAMHDAYVDLRGEEGPAPSPVLDTLLQRQGSDGFDTIVIEPAEPARAGVVFLHGFAGSFTLECWLVASAARAIGAVTVCPAVGFSGHWTTEDGEKTLRSTIDYLHARGVRRLYLAGLSNGGVGAAWLAPRFASELSGLIIISGAPAAGGSELPTLVIQGEHDPMMSAATAKTFAARVHATYAGFDGGHFVMLMRRSEVREAIARWLRLHSG